MESGDQVNDTAQGNETGVEFIIREGGGRQRTRVLPVTSVGWEPFHGPTPAIRLQLWTADPDVLVSAVIRARAAGFVINATGGPGVEYPCRTLAEVVLGGGVAAYRGARKAGGAARPAGLERGGVSAPARGGRQGDGGICWHSRAAAPGLDAAPGRLEPLADGPERRENGKRVPS